MKTARAPETSRKARSPGTRGDDGRELRIRRQSLHRHGDPARYRPYRVWKDQGLAAAPGPS